MISRLTRLATTLSIVCSLTACGAPQLSASIEAPKPTVTEEVAKKEYCPAVVHADPVTKAYFHKLYNAATPTEYLMPFETLQYLKHIADQQAAIAKHC